MNKPWDNELTPTADCNATKWGNFRRGDFVDGDLTRNLERRLRHAERLLEDVLGDATIFYEEKTLSKVAAHLEAANAEDNA